MQLKQNYREPAHICNQTYKLFSVFCCSYNHVISDDYIELVAMDCLT
jgi:hypothetical protein